MKKQRSCHEEAGKVTPNLLAKDCHAERPNQNITGSSYLEASFISRLCLNYIMVKSFVMPSANAPITAKVAEILDKVFSRFLDEGELIYHSDQGWQ